MRGIVKTANRFDSLWTTVVMLPAFVMLANAGISLHQGKSTPADFANAAQYTAGTFTGQYLPYVETAAGGILAGVNKVAQSVGSCLPGSSAPIYLKPGMVHQNGCALGNMAAAIAPIKPHAF